MSEQLKDIQTLLGVSGLSDETKLAGIREILSRGQEPVIDVRVVEQKKSNKWKRKRGDAYPNACVKLTQNEIDTVAREFYKNGNRNKRAVGKLIGRSASSVGNILRKLRSGHYRTTLNIKDLNFVQVGDVRVAKKFNKMG